MAKRNRRMAVLAPPHGLEPCSSAPEAGPVNCDKVAVLRYHFGQVNDQSFAYRKG
jgi:hypothetical protein